MGYLRLLSLVVMSLALWPARAGEFSKIDQVVRETVVEAYSQGWDDHRFNMSPDDIWALEIDPENTDGCLVTVTGLAKKPGYWGSRTARFWVCITRDEAGSGYQGELIDDDIIADE